MPQYTTYAELITYFQGMATNVTELQGVTVGDDEALMNQMNTQIRYPHLWVETPSVNFINSEINPATRFRFAIAVVAGTQRDSAAASNQKLSDMLDVLEKVWARIKYDADTNEYFDLVLAQSEGDPVRQWSGDNCFGWRLTPVLIDLPRCECDCDPPEEEEPAP